MKRKGQMEMVGLVVIVILITLGILLLAVFSLKESPEKKIFTREGLAYSVMSALTKTNVECVRDNGDVEYLELGKVLAGECAEAKASGLDDLYKCNNLPVCDFYRTETERLLGLTLGNWNKPYQFEAKLFSGGGEGVPLFEPILGNDGCENRERDAAQQPLPSDAGEIKSSLFICD